MEQKVPLKVRYGTIYTEDGNGIDNMAVIIDKEAGLMKYGDSEKWVEKCYTEMIEKYKKAGLEEFSESLILVKLDRYNGVLTIEDICTLTNYMILCSSNGHRIMQILAMEESELKSEIENLRSYGY